MTNQGNGSGPNNLSEQVNITYRKNTIWNSEYSFEYWNRDETQVTDRILFEGNLCVNAGHGWAHGQRPDPNGGHLMFYHNAAKTSHFVVRNNVFCVHLRLKTAAHWRFTPTHNPSTSRSPREYGHLNVNLNLAHLATWR